MKILRLALLAVPMIAGMTALRAQEGGSPQDEIITDFGIDEYIYQPKYTLHIGTRQLSGAKSSFSGRGTVNSIIPPTDITTPNIARAYHDGTVGIDTRTIVDSDGIASPISPDGFTNSWTYNFADQVSDAGYMAFHGYSADVIDPGARSKNANSSYGVEVVVSRDMGKLGKKLDWTLFAGLSLNDLNDKTSDTLAARVTTTTDYYSLNGQTPPVPPYVAPSTSSVSVFNPDGSLSVVNVDTTTLIGNKPLGRITTVSDGVVINNWKVKGAYFTFRAGPSISYSITQKLKATLSVGAALVFVGSTYTVDQIYTPEIGENVMNTVDNTTEKLMPGYYADATLEYEFTERAGAYFGALYQSTGSYEQTITTASASYATKIDLASLQGFRMGMNFRF
ncbi:MAG: hypothetical protein JWM32_80 [Verrucomicrobia bacterium]|nr:hypothetical protein [Verrucomicrobiota bacterium]